MYECDIAIVGGGMAGAALGFGLTKSASKVVMLDQGDRDLRAARGNFGLVWVQGKGADNPAYAQWTQLSARLWPNLAEQLLSVTGIDVQLTQRGGIHYCLDEAELADYSSELAQQAAVSNGQFDYQILSASELQELEPNISGAMAGGGFSRHDGHVNPLLLLRALQAAFIAQGGQYLPHHGVQSIVPMEHCFRLQTQQGEVRAGKVVLAAGLDNRRLAPMLGLRQPLRPERGQLLITERLPPLLNYPSIHLRQTQEGTMQIGYSSENVGLDDSNTPQVMAALARRAISLLPALQHRQLVRAWGALRVMSPDGYPIYEQATHGTAEAYAISCHSAVTLAAAHALQLAPMLDKGALGCELSPFSAQRLQA